MQDNSRDYKYCYAGSSEDQKVESHLMAGSEPWNLEFVDKVGCRHRWPSLVNW